jgi:hypothetical protein
MPRCSAIIVTYNSAGSITSCLDALAQQDCEIVVVDNASQDDTVALVQAFAKEHAVELLRISRNLGFAGGVNHGVRAASGDVFLILNPDTIAEVGAVGALVDCLDRTGAAAAGGALLENDGTPARGFAFRRLPTFRVLLSEVLLFNQLWPRNPINRRYRCLDADYAKLQEVEQPAGACLAVRREAWDNIGGMDTQFTPVWFEDVDFCKRLLDAGEKIVYCPRARFQHSGAHSVGTLRFADKQLFWYANMLRYARKHFAPWKVIVLRWGIAKGAFLRWLAVLAGKGPPDIPVDEAIAAYKKVIHLAFSGRI